jgi:hypothetical protein
MAKFAALAMSIDMDNSAGTPVTISNDVATISLTDSRGEQDVTGLDKSAFERLQLLADSQVTLGGNGWPSSATMAVFTNMANSRTLVLNWPDSGTYTVEVMIFGFSPSRGADGAATWSCDLKLSNGTAGAWS